jgi:hypothetical protein
MSNWNKNVLELHRIWLRHQMVAMIQMLASPLHWSASNSQRLRLLLSLDDQIGCRKSNKIPIEHETLKTPHHSRRQPFKFPISSTSEFHIVLSFTCLSILIIIFEGISTKISHQIFGRESANRIPFEATFGLMRTRKAMENRFPMAIIPTSSMRIVKNFIGLL